MARTQDATMPTWLTRTLLVGLGFIFVMMPVHAFVSTWGGTVIGPLWVWKSWKELLLVLLVLPVFVWLATNRSALRQVAKNPLAIGVVLYIALSVVLAITFWSENGSQAVMAGLAMNLRYLGIAALAYLLFRYGDLSETWLVRGMWFVVSAGVFVAVLGIMQILIIPSDYLVMFGYEKGVTIAPYTLIDNNPDLLRAFGTLRGPNDFGAFLILPIILVITQVRRLPIWVSISLLGLLGWGLILSSSRSAWIGMVVALMAYAFYTIGRRLKLTYIIGLLAILVITFAGMFYAAVNVAVLRQAVFHSSPGDPSLTEGSTDKHLTATLNGITRVVEQPLGCGVGCAGPASYYGEQGKISENYFVQIAEETGIVGLIFFLCVVGYVAYRLAKNRRQQVLSRALLVTLFGYVAIGLLLHVWSDDPLSITWWLLTGAVIGNNEKSSWRKSKSSSRSKT